MSGLAEVQAALRPSLKRWGFRVRAQHGNRVTDEGLVQVITFLTSRLDPRGAPARFTVELGVYLPEIDQVRGTPAKTNIGAIHCEIRARLARLANEHDDRWWPAEAAAAPELAQRLERDGLPFLDRFATRAKIVEACGDRAEVPHVTTPRILCAIVLAKQGKLDEARPLLRAQWQDARDRAYLESLAGWLKLGPLA